MLCQMIHRIQICVLKCTYHISIVANELSQPSLTLKMYAMICKWLSLRMALMAGLYRVPNKVVSFGSTSSSNVYSSLLYTLTWYAQIYMSVVIMELHHYPTSCTHSFMILTLPWHLHLELCISNSKTHSYKHKKWLFHDNIHNYSYILKHNYVHTLIQIMFESWLTL